MRHISQHQIFLLLLTIFLHKTHRYISDPKKLDKEVFNILYCTSENVDITILNHTINTYKKFLKVAVKFEIYSKF